MSACHAKITLCYYIQLITTQFHRKKYQSSEIGRLVNELFEKLSNEFCRILPRNRFKNFEKLSSQVELANEWLKTYKNEKDSEVRELAL